MEPSMNNISYRQLGRLAEIKAHNENAKRIFGRDITNNLNKQLKKNVSIYEKVPIATKVEKVEPKLRSRSLYGHKEVLSNGSMMHQAKDAIHEYKQ